MPKKPKPSCRDETQDAFDKQSQLMSSTDCTGLIPGGVQDEAEAEAYRDLYSIPPPKPRKK